MADLTPNPNAMLDQMQQQLTTLREANRGKWSELNRMGVQPDPASVMSTRFETFLAAVLSPQDRLAFEVAFEHNMADNLAQCLTEARKMQLAGAIPPPPGGPAGNARKLIVPGQ